MARPIGILKTEGRSYGRGPAEQEAAALKNSGFRLLQEAGFPSCFCSQELPRIGGMLQPVRQLAVF